MLLGIVKKNAIMQIDFALDAQRAGRPPPAILPGRNDPLLRYFAGLIGKAGGMMRSTPAPSHRQRGTCSQ